MSNNRTINKVKVIILKWAIQIFIKPNYSSTFNTIFSLLSSASSSVRRVLIYKSIPRVRSPVSIVCWLPRLIIVICSSWSSWVTWRGRGGCSCCCWLGGCSWSSCRWGRCSSRLRSCGFIINSSLSLVRNCSVSVISGSSRWSIWSWSAVTRRWSCTIGRNCCHGSIWTWTWAWDWCSITVILLVATSGIDTSATTVVGSWCNNTEARLLINVNGNANFSNNFESPIEINFEMSKSCRNTL